MRARSWLAVSAGTLTGSALAITGSPQSSGQAGGYHRPPRATLDLTKIPARRWRTGQGGHLVYFAQTPNNRTITLVSRRST